MICVTQCCAATLARRRRATIAGGVCWALKGGITGIRREQMMDIVYIGLTLIFFGLCWGLVKLCERL